MLQFFRQISNKLGSSIYAGLQKPSTFQQQSFIRQLQREMRADADDPLSCPLAELPVVIFDFETTGFSPETGDQILSIGAVKMKGSQIATEESFFYSLVRYDRPLRTEIVQLTKITSEELTAAPAPADVLLQFFKYVNNRTLIAHHASHEKAFLRKAVWDLWRIRFDHRIIDTSFLIQLSHPLSKPLSLEAACQECGIEIKNRHHALGDAQMTALIWKYYLEKAQENGFSSLLDVYVHLSKNR